MPVRENVKLFTSPYLMYWEGHPEIKILNRITGEFATFPSEVQNTLYNHRNGAIPVKNEKSIEQLVQSRLLLSAEDLKSLELLTTSSVDIEVAGTCNARCVFCPRDQLEQGRGVGRMKSETFYSVIDSLLPNLRFVGFAGIGEPTLHPKLPEFLRYLKSNDVATLLVTNCSLMKPSMIDKILDTGVKAIQVSFNGIEKASYESHMPGMDFDLNFTNLHNLIKAAGTDTSIFVSAVETMENKQDLTNFSTYWAQYGVTATVVPCHSRGGTIETTSQDSAEMPRRCGLFNSRVFVSWDGKALSCCHDIDGSTSFGPLNKDTVESIRKEKLRIIANNDWPELCRGCDEPAKNMVLQ